MNPLRRVLTTLAATALLCVGSAALAAPAQAEVNANLLGGILYATSNGLTHVGSGGSDLVALPNLLSPIV
ncbi:hypothetical protein BLA24_12970 [Streptomyces cinnamoneus]|uniref:Chaplin n=1 Tax=Streptomyces cinnamoneus TaxID=53446 RepID=A0A2G1XK27_STRCJ|nr:hypothetical protein [Streptomyces cinnamoneus]PHQ51604.1 hypothetical protein BLA24_12970 [Streptomyces cinnamoneus]PPT14397.1 hypothetical protein CYQ11_17330 [Streptomyces cinnamoneus]